MYIARSILKQFGILRRQTPIGPPATFVPDVLDSIQLIQLILDKSSILLCRAAPGPHGRVLRHDVPSMRQSAQNRGEEHRISRFRRHPFVQAQPYYDTDRGSVSLRGREKFAGGPGASANRDTYGGAGGARKPRERTCSNWALAAPPSLSSCWRAVTPLNPARVRISLDFVVEL